jgi:hypothetical protein
MTNRGRVALVLVVFLGLTTLELLRLHGPAPAPASAPAGAFSAARAIATLHKVFVDVPHPLGTAAHDTVRSRIEDELKMLGYAVERQHVFACNAAASCGMVDNLVARMPAQTTSADSIVLAAHYDSVPAGPGTSDDATGVATLLEIARAIRDESFSNPIVFLIDDGEEAGLLGAEGFMADQNRSRSAVFVINLEARGTSGTPFLFETSGENRWIMTRVASALPRPVTTSMFATIYDLLPNDTDLTVFKRAGRSGINFAYLGDGSQYHTPLDDFAHVDARSVQHRGDQILAMVREFGRVNLRERKGGNAVWFDVFALFVAWWPASWTVWLSVISSALAIVAMVLRIREGEATVSAIALGLAAFFAVALVATMLGLGFWWASGLRAASAMFDPHAWLAVATMWLTGIGTGVGIIGLAGRRSLFDSLFLGQTVAWNALALATAVMLPGASYLLLVPAAVMSTVSLLRAIADVSETAMVVLALAAAATVLFPFGLVLYDALGGTSFPAVALLLALVSTTFAPLLVSGARPLGGALLAMALVTGVVSLLLPGWSPSHPRHLSIAHVTDVDHGRARWQMDSMTPALRSAARFGAARTNVAPWYGSNGSSYVANAPAIAVAPFTATVTSDSMQNGLRTVVLDVRSARQSPRISVSWRSDAALESIRVNGVTPPPPPPRFRSYLAPKWNRILVRGSSATIQIVTRGTSPAEATITDATFGLPAIGAPLSAARNVSGAVPIGEGDLTLVERHLKW